MRLSHAAIAIAGLVALSACDYHRQLGTLVLQEEQEAVIAVQVPKHDPSWTLKLKMASGPSKDQDVGPGKLIAYLRNDDPLPLHFTTVHDLDTIAPGQEIPIFDGSISDLSQQNASVSPPWWLSSTGTRKVNLRLRFKPAFSVGEKHTLHISVVASDPLP